MRLGAVVLVILTVAPLVLFQGNDVASAASSDACIKFQMPGVGTVCERAPGDYEVFSRTGESLGFTHGPDPVCEGCEEPLVPLAGDSAPFCVASTSTEYNIVVIYARASDDTDRFSTMVGTIRSIVSSANAMVDDAAIATGDRLALRVKCTSGVVDVANAVLPTSKSVAGFDSVVRDLQNQGFNNNRKKYWVYYDDVAADCASCAGVGHRYADDSDSVNNFNNGNSQAVPMFAVSFNSASVRTMLHELGHNLGAVQNSAPRSSGAGHCTDGRDTMCYNDGGSNSAQCQPDFTCSGVCSVEVFDCNKDTYCHATPAPGSYLDTHWQACHRETRFLAWTGTNVAPQMASVQCGPDPSIAGEPMSCLFSANDASTGVFYQIDWGDGSAITREPASGTVAPGASRTVAHTYATSGARTVRINATDNGSPALTSTDLTYSLTVNPANPAPVMTSVSCTPANPNEDQLVTCTFSATDDNNVFYALSWGDGAPTQRVPTSGAVAPGATQSATHTYSVGGSFTLTVTPTDVGSPAKTGAPMSRAIDVIDVNEAPILAPISCPTAIQRTGTTITCTFSATDDSASVSYRVEWGDGNVTTTSAGAPGAARTASHAYVEQGDYTVNVTATDDGSPPLSSAVRTALLRVRTDAEGPTLAILDPRPGVAYVGCTNEVPTAGTAILFVRTGCVRASATDTSGVHRVEVLRDGRIVAVDVTAPYELTFAIGSFEQDIRYQVRAWDNVGFFRSLVFDANEIGGSL